MNYFFRLVYLYITSIENHAQSQDKLHDVSACRKPKQLEEKNTPSSLLQNAGPVDEDTAPSPCVESCRRTAIGRFTKMA